MTRREFRAFLDLMMCSDPFPDSVDRNLIENFLNKESIIMGFPDWIEAYHDFNP